MKKLSVILLSLLASSALLAHDLRPENTVVIPLEIRVQSLSPVLSKFLSIDNEKVINIVVDTYGGEVGITTEFVTAMRQAKSSGITVNCYIYKAISAGFDIFMACSNRYVFEDPIILQHEARIPGTAFPQMKKDGLIDQDTLLDLYNELFSTNEDRFATMVKMLPKQDKADLHRVFKASKPFKKEYIQELKDSGYIQLAKESDLPQLFKITKSAKLAKLNPTALTATPSVTNSEDLNYDKQMKMCIDSVGKQLKEQPDLANLLFILSNGDEKTATAIVVDFCNEQVLKVLGQPAHK